MKSTILIAGSLLASCLVLGLVAYEAGRMVSRRSLRAGASPTATATDCVAEKPPKMQPGAPNPLRDVTDDVGLDFQHVVGPLGTYYMPESIGAGGALFDYDGDGRLDIYLVNCGRSPDAIGDFAPGTRLENRLYRQNEQGKFVDVTELAGVGDTGYGAGCAVGDVDNDGCPDLYVTNYGRDCLFRNNGDGTFSDVTETAGLNNPDWGTCAAFFDYDRDGWLDLVVVNYTADEKYKHSIACGFRDGRVSYCGPKKFAPTIDRLFHNDGAGGGDESGSLHFTEVTAFAGLDTAPTYGFGVVCADFSGDGWPDVFIANDAAPNRLWINQRDGTFRDEGAMRGVAFGEGGISEAGMGVAVGDVNGDGCFDLVSTHLSMEVSRLYVSDGMGAFVDGTSPAGLDKPTRKRTGWGAALLDLNHDGHLDLPLVHGLVVPCHSGFPYHGVDKFQPRRERIENADAFWLDYADLNLLLLGDGKGGFRDESQAGGHFCAAIASGRSLIYGDVDNDGDVDLLVTNCGGRARLYRNDFDKQGHWLMVRAYDPQSHRDAYGAEIVVKSGSRSQIRLVSPASSYLASNDVRSHFGLGNAEHYDEIVVRWPDGAVAAATEVFSGGPADQSIIVRRGEGRPSGNVE